VSRESSCIHGGNVTRLIVDPKTEVYADERREWVRGVTETVNLRRYQGRWKVVPPILVYHLKQLWEREKE
jgi:hypothetical protein